MVSYFLIVVRDSDFSCMFGYCWWECKLGLEKLWRCLALSDKVIVWAQGGDGGLTAKRHKETHGSDGNVLCLD